MARAATRKGKGAKQQPARPRQSSGAVSGSARAVEQELFFGRIRRQAKWVFALLAVVFAGTFAFLGVGSGQGAGLLDIGHWFGGGSSGPSITNLQKQAAEHPKDPNAYLKLSQALDGKGRTAEAIDAMKHYTALHPRSLGGWNQLVGLYDKRARQQTAQVQAAIASTNTSYINPSEFAPVGELGKAVAAYQDPIAQILSQQARTKTATLGAELLQTRQDQLTATQNVADLSRTEPSALVAVAQTANDAALAAQVAGNTSAIFSALQAQLGADRTLIKRFPDDPFAVQARKQVKALEKQVGGQPQAASSSHG
jgi:hypothetical protein